MRLEVVKKVLLTVVLFVTLRRSALAVMWGLAAMSFVEMCLNTAAARRYAALPLRRIARTLLPVVLPHGGHERGGMGRGTLHGPCGAAPRRSKSSSGRSSIVPVRPCCAWRRSAKSWPWCAEG